MADASLHDEFVRLFAARSMALVQNDVGFFRRLLADDFSYTNASGATLDKTAYLQFYIESQLVKWQAQEWDDLHVRRYGEVAVVTGRIHDRAIFEETERDAYFRSTQIFVQQAGEWRYVAGHTTNATAV